MVPKSVDELQELISRLRLGPPDGVAEARNALPVSASPADFLQVLERRQVLTPLQCERIRKGETDGLVIAGHRLLYRNASGSFARVYRVESVETGQMVGMKVLRERWSSDTDTVRLFHREGEIGKRLKHPNIVPIFDVGSEGRFHYILMEFVEGGNMRDFLQIRKKLAPGEACRYAIDMARALEYALRQGVTHRDMKLTNVLMSSQGVAKLIDFGLAADEAMLSRSGGPDLAQALEYSTLEKGTDAPRNDPRSDLFFLGTILYELLSGHPPYPRTRDREERKNFSRYRDIRSITNVEPSLNWKLASIVGRLLQINPALRYQSATEVIQDLEAAARELGETIAAPFGAASKNGAPTILCVEDRPKYQDVLRNYFAKHGFRVLLLSDAERALNRLRTSPPDCLVLFGDLGDHVVEAYRLALGMTDCPTAVVLVLNRHQTDYEKQLGTSDPRGSVMMQPVQLRDLRMAITRLIGGSSGKLTNGGNHRA